MRKLKCILLSLFVILFIFGCTKQQQENKEVKRVVTFAKADTNSGLILFYDEDFNLLFTKECEYPYMLFYDDDAIYVSEDGENYSSFLYANGKEGRKLTNIKNPIDILYDDSYFTYQEGGFCKIYMDGGESCKTDYVSALYKNENYIYYIDSSNMLHICDGESFEEISSGYVESSEFLSFTKVDGKVYIANDYGFTLIDGTEIGSTYVYPNDFTELNNVNGKMIFFEENGESAVYLVSFDKYKMILTPYYNEEYYRNIDFDKEYQDYFDQGYEIVDFYELEY